MPRGKELKKKKVDDGNKKSKKGFGTPLRGAKKDELVKVRISYMNSTRTDPIPVRFPDGKTRKIRPKTIVKIPRYFAERLDNKYKTTYKQMGNTTSEAQRAVRENKRDLDMNKMRNNNVIKGREKVFNVSYL